MEKNITVNGVAVSEAELMQKKEEVNKQPDVKLVEVSTNVYKTQIRG